MNQLLGFDGASAPTAPLIIMVGAPGSGKSTWAARRFPEDQLFGADMFRRMLTGGNVLEQGATGAAVAMLRELVHYRLDNALTTVVDATNVNWSHRDDLRHAAQRRGRPAVAIMMHTSLAECLRRNRDRTPGFRPWAGANDLPVPDQVVERMHAAALSDPPHPDEFDLTVHLHPTSAGVAYAYPGLNRSKEWAEQLLSGSHWGAAVTLLGRGALLPWPTPVNARG